MESCGLRWLDTAFTSDVLRRVRKESAVKPESFHTSSRRLFSPNGAVTQSPGLVRLRTYPRCGDVPLFNPNGVAAQMAFTRLRLGESQPLRGWSIIQSAYPG